MGIFLQNLAHQNAENTRPPTGNKRCGFTRDGMRERVHPRHQDQARGFVCDLLDEGINLREVKKISEREHYEKFVVAFILLLFG